MKYTDYPELSDDMDEATEQVEKARQMIQRHGTEVAFRSLTSGYLSADAVEVALNELAGEVEHIRESPEYGDRNA